MADHETLVVHPGDVLQDTDGLFLLASECHGWGVGAMLRWRDANGELRERYVRLRPGQFSPVGVARMVPPEVQQRRRDSLKAMFDQQREAGVVPDPKPIDFLLALVAAHDGDADQVEAALEAARQYLAGSGQ